MKRLHSFHIPVMGIGFTLDTPLKVAPFGIDSVVSLVDDILIEKMRKFYCESFKEPYKEISNKVEDFRAKRITAYLNFLNDATKKKIEEFKTAAIEKSGEVREYFKNLPDSSKLKEEFESFKSKCSGVSEFGSWVKESVIRGSIDVNIMTKLDREAYRDGKVLPTAFNDGHSAIRGFANSNLNSAVVLSAGFNPRLFGYIEEFDDFYPDRDGNIKKRIILKVSDYRSAFIQGKYFAKKGIWVSEYRVESGLNCGGHAFVSDGMLLGPILLEFRENKKTLEETLYPIVVKSLVEKGRDTPKSPLNVSISSQGGVGTAEEHNFLLNYYGVDSVGWGSPFMLVPEAVSVDDETLDKLCKAKEEDLYLSDISPLGVKFNNLRGNSRDLERIEDIKNGKYGRVCTKFYASSNTEFTKRPVCTASRAYQTMKVNQLKSLNLPKEEYEKKFRKIVDKSCICVGLGTSLLKANGIKRSNEGEGVSVCPGPNTAYFTKKSSLTEMIDHIYGRTNIIERNDRPNFLIKELSLYIDYFKNMISEANPKITVKEKKKFDTFGKNLKEGIEYYNRVFNDPKVRFSEGRDSILKELKGYEYKLDKLIDKANNIIVLS
ncbi:MAG: hypothetical protein CR982_04960 [Candidatus Cloacimonadota bacterium]|nr:MAG: hypothetical protein CR982_04960 [Candidatus Cloacimonadota bacterium]PIE78555.1 MAG: hypothetical protein CSA15_07365 [Candidatus Delongbacteria bacterium]